MPGPVGRWSSGRSPNVAFAGVAVFGVVLSAVAVLAARGPLPPHGAHRRRLRALGGAGDRGRRRACSPAARTSPSSCSSAPCSRRRSSSCCSWRPWCDRSGRCPQRRSGAERGRRPSSPSSSATPGSTREIRRRLSIPIGTLDYHLYQLGRKGLIAVRFQGGYRLPVSRDAPRLRDPIPEEVMLLLALLRQGVPRAILLRAVPRRVNAARPSSGRRSTRPARTSPTSSSAWRGPGCSYGRGRVRTGGSASSIRGASTRSC